MKKSNLNETEINTISLIARESKFAFIGNDLLYPIDNKDRLKFFLNSYDFFLNLSTNNLVDVAIRNKITTFIQQYQKIYKEAIKLDNRFKKPTSWRVSKISRDLDIFMTDNLEDVRILSNEVFPLGKITKGIDPDKDIGLY